jgi:hypothetical protein
MRELHKLTHQPVNLSMRQGDEIVYIERTYSERSGMQVVRAVGGRAPLHLTSVGKLFLAHDDPQRCAPTPRAPACPATPATASPTLPALERELAQVRRLGVARDDEELELGVRCMAAGIYDDQGKLIAGLSVSAPADRLEESWLERVKATAAQISAVGSGTAARAQRALEASAGCLRRRRQHRLIQPLANALGIADARVAPGRIEQHHDQLASGQLRLHHQTAPGLGDVAGLLQTDVPVGLRTRPLVLRNCNCRLPTDLRLARDRQLTDDRCA